MQEEDILLTGCVLEIVNLNVTWCKWEFTNLTGGIPEIKNYLLAI